jgi:oligoendopeptidase F
MTTTAATNSADTAASATTTSTAAIDSARALAESLGVADVRFDHSALLTEAGAANFEDLLDAAEKLASSFTARRGTIAIVTPAEFGVMLHDLAAIYELLERAGASVYLNYTVNVADPTAGAAMAKLQERSTAIGNRLVFFDLEWAAADDAHADALLADPATEFCRHWLRVKRLGRPYLLTEPEEKLIAEKSVTGVAAWTRLYDEQLSAVSIDLGGELGEVALDVALSQLQSPDRANRLKVAKAIDAGLAPGLRTRAYIYNTLLADKAADDRMRTYPTWSTSRNMSNQASDASVAALVEAVTGRYDIVQRWYKLKAQLLGLERLHFSDRNAQLSVGGNQERIPWLDAKATILDSFNSFSPRIAGLAADFFDRNWIHAPAGPGKQGGAFCMPTVPNTNPYVLVNYTGMRTDVLTLAHELGHAVHFSLSQASQPIFQVQVPLTVAETASVFGETVTFSRILGQVSDPAARLNLLASSLDAAIATVFRQVSMYRFEELCHTSRRSDGELSVDGINERWITSQQELFGYTVDTTGYESWWSYVHHFVHVPGYVYAYAFGQLLATSVYQRYLEVGPSFVPRYEDMLSAGGSKSPEDLAAMVDCDLRDPNFWANGLSLIERTLISAEEAAAALNS